MRFKLKPTRSVQNGDPDSREIVRGTADKIMQGLIAIGVAGVGFLVQQSCSLRQEVTATTAILKDHMTNPEIHQNQAVKDASFDRNFALHESPTLVEIRAAREDTNRRLDSIERILKRK